MIRLIAAVPVLALADALRVGSQVARNVGLTIAGGNLSPLNRIL